MISFLPTSIKCFPSKIGHVFKNFGREVVKGLWPNEFVPSELSGDSLLSGACKSKWNEHFIQVYFTHPPLNRSPATFRMLGLKSGRVAFIQVHLDSCGTKENSMQPNKVEAEIHDKKSSSSTGRIVVFVVAQRLTKMFRLVSATTVVQLFKLHGVFLCRARYGLMENKADYF